MARIALWKRLTETDFNAMNAGASPYGEGGGARHIALGVIQPGFRLDSFLLSPGKNDVTVVADSPAAGAANLSFHSNPYRRGGEWYVRDQYTHRHPAWTAASGFPSAYDPSDPPVIFVVAVGTRFFARFALLSSLVAAGKAIPPNVLGDLKGIASVNDSFSTFLGVPDEDTLDAFHEQNETAPEPPFDPADLEDGRRRVFASIMRRQGQVAFRKSLFAAYEGRCAISRTKLPWILEAAHITPYRGPKTNTLENGLLLRADFHTLFDLGLIAVDPATMSIKTSSLIAKSTYSKVDGEPLFQPAKVSERPSAAAIAEHFRGFRA